MAQIQKFPDSDCGHPELAGSRSLLAGTLSDLQAMVAALTGYLVDSAQKARELYRLGLESVPLLPAVGDLPIGWLLLHQAEIALNALDADPDPKDPAFCAGKVAGAKFFVKSVLPQLAAERRIIEAVDLSVMELREEAF